MKIKINPKEFAKINTAQGEHYDEDHSTIGERLGFIPHWVEIEVCSHFPDFCDCDYSSNMIEYSDGKKIYTEFGVTTEMLECDQI